MKRINSEFQPTPAVLPDLTRICRTLAGWPLAIELTASWVERLPVAEIADRIAANTTALNASMPDLPIRHRSMEAVLAGSYDLLTPAQQRVLARFSILRGGCTAEAAESVLLAGLEDLVVLTRRTLLQKQNGRFAIHELIRQFALTKLENNGEKISAERAHAEYYLQLIVSLESDLHGPHPLSAIGQLRPERENLYQAWRWAVENLHYDWLTAALPGLTRFYNLTGLLREGEALLRKTRNAVTQLPFVYDLLFAHTHLYMRLGNYEAARTELETLPSLDSLPPNHQLQAHLHWGMLSIIQGFIPESLHHYEHTLNLARALKHQEGIITSLTQLGILHTYDGRYETEIATELEKTSDLWLQRTVYSFLGASSIHHSRYREACVHWQKALAISLELEDWYAVATYHNNLGDAFRELGEFTEAEQAFQQAITLAQSLHHEVIRKNVLEGWARLHVLRGEYEQAIPLAQEAVELAVADGNQAGEMAAHACLGHAYVGLQLWEQAEEAYNQAVVLLPDLPLLALESIAGLAYVRWQQGDTMAAREHIDCFLELLGQGRIEGFASPSLSYGRAAEVLQVLGEEEQAETLFARVMQRN
ncbi:MAG: tetratricopeptide repeat protein [Anaerolineae bacterium]|nr:tetratricopeptide repeat protein [Anaerolineae bacterium]